MESEHHGHAALSGRGSGPSGEEAPELQVASRCRGCLPRAMEEAPELVSLAEATAALVARAAECYQREDPNVDPLFWETLYGPYGPGADDWGMLDWSEYDGYDK